MKVQPFIPFEKKYLTRLMQIKQYYWVSQSYSRGTSIITGYKIPILLTNYDDSALAEIHRKAVKGDIYAAVIDIQKETHFNILTAMLQPTSKYYLYWGVIDDFKKLERTLNEQFAENLKRYIDKKTTWRIGSGEAVRPGFQLTFGELYITLKWSGQSIRIKFDEIEKA